MKLTRSLSVFGFHTAVPNRHSKPILTSPFAIITITPMMRCYYTTKFCDARGMGHSALAAFQDASRDGRFPGPAENARIPAKELEAFLAALNK